LLSRFEEKESDVVGESDLNNELIQVTLLKNKFKHDCEVKGMQIDTLSRELRLCKEISMAHQANLEEVQEALRESQLENVRFR
jgi:hypothetical protein